MSKLIKSAGLLAFVISCLDGFGQTKVSQQSIKMYSNLHRERTDQRGNVDTSTGLRHQYYYSALSYGGITPAFAWTTDKGRMQELELSQLHWDRTSQETLAIIDSTGSTEYVVSGVDVNRFNISIRYENIFKLLKNKELNQFSFFLGSSVQPYFALARMSPKISTSFQSSEMDFGIKLDLIPRINYNLGKKWFLDVNMPMRIANIDYFNTRVENPSFTAQQQKTGTFSFWLFPRAFSMRFGVGVRI